MPKRKGDDENDWGEDSDIYLPDESLKGVTHNINAHIVYKNGEILVEKDDDYFQVERIETSRDYIIAKLWLKLTDYCREQALPLLDKANGNSNDLVDFLQKFL